MLFPYTALVRTLNPGTLRLSLGLSRYTEAHQMGSLQAPGQMDTRNRAEEERVMALTKINGNFEGAGRENWQRSHSSFKEICQD